MTCVQISLKEKATLGFQFSSHTFFFFKFQFISILILKLLWLCPSGRMTTSVWMHICLGTWSTLLLAQPSQCFPLRKAAKNCTTRREAPANSLYSLGEAFTSSFQVPPLRMRVVLHFEHLIFLLWLFGSLEHTRSKLDQFFFPGQNGDSVRP